MSQPVPQICYLPHAEFRLLGEPVFRLSEGARIPSMVVAWTGVFADWAAAPKHYNDFVLKIIERTYHFLAPRFMSFQEWTTAESRLKKSKLRATTW
jgi:hypothetical protein